MRKAVLLPHLDAIVQRRIIDLHVVNRDREKRAFPRYAISLGVSCRAVNEHFEPVGEPFEAVTRDISEGGVSLISDSPIGPGFLTVTFEDGHGSAVEMLVRLRRCEPFDSLFLAAGSFVEEPFPIA